MKKLAEIEKAITEYHHALDTRQHGDVAQSICITQIEEILDMQWIRGATLPVSEDGKGISDAGLPQKKT